MSALYTQDRQIMSQSVYTKDKDHPHFGQSTLRTGTDNISAFTQGREWSGLSQSTLRTELVNVLVFTQDRQAISQVSLISRQRGVRSQSYCTDNTASLSTSQDPIHIT